MVMIGDEADLPYDRPPLSKQMLLAEADHRSAALHYLKPEQWYADNSIQLLLNTRAVDLQRRNGQVVVGTDTAGEVQCERVIVATGSRPRRLTVPTADDSGCESGLTGPDFGPNYLRTAVDAQQLRTALASTTGRMSVIGAGFIGLEAASAAGKLGWRVDVLERAATPLSRVLPHDVAERCLAGATDYGVNVRYNTFVQQWKFAGRRCELILNNDAVLAADLVVVGIGAIPNVEWLTDSGVDIDDGVVCDGHGRTSMPGVWAAGDVARWPNTATGTHARHEQWQSAREQARLVAADISGDGTAWNAVPYFWSEMFGTRIQSCGAITSAMDVVEIADAGRTLMLLSQPGAPNIQAAVAFNAPRWFGIAKRWTSEDKPLQDCLRASQDFAPGAHLRFTTRKETA
jgi:3-phenylpropionate/trans-cinnamate dioxygenase ferredoxin reductase subunit